MKFNNTKEAHYSSSSAKLYALVIYDISETKRRNRFVKIMNSYGQRVQKSAFEFLINNAEYKNLCVKIDRFYSQEQGDELRIYKFRGEADVIIYGNKDLVEENDLGLEFI